MKKLSDINEGVFRNSIIRTSGGAKRRESDIDYIPVDLGLPSGTLWCDRNVGAEQPEDYGWYFQWGGTEDITGNDCDLLTCPYWNDKKHMFEKYNEIDKKTVLEPEDDAATALMGGKWHMPTAEQCEELIKNTDIKWTFVKGVGGQIFKSRKNGNSIFIPLAGYMASSGLISTRIDFHVWSSSVNSNDSKLVYNCIPYAKDVVSENRYFGFSVRGVMDNKSK